MSPGCDPGTAADQRFMNLTMALTAVLRVVKVLSGKQARRVLRSADRGRT